MSSIYKRLKQAAEGSDDAITALLSTGSVESYTENDRGMITVSFIYTDNNGNTYSYNRFGLDKSKFNVLESSNKNQQLQNDLGNINLKNGARFYARDYNEALIALDTIKNHYEDMIDTLVSNEEYSRLQKVKDAIEEIEEKLEYYRQKQGKNPEGGQVQMGAV